MKRLALFIFAFIAIGLFAQVPKIEIISSGNLDATLTKGDSVLKYIVIKNTGNRELIWNVTTGGPDVTFTKPDSADYTVSNAQDRISNNVWLTRGDDSPLFNHVLESNYSGSISPEGTEWVRGTLDNFNPDNFEGFIYAVTNRSSWGMPMVVGMDLVCHLIEEDLYAQFKFTSWTQAGKGGGFSYVRTGVASWIDFLKKTDTVLVGKTDTIKFYLNSKLATQPGLSEGWIFINSNDISNSKVKFVSKITIASTPDITENESPVDMGDVFINSTSTYKMQVLNNGQDILKVTDVKVKSGFFSVTPKVFDVPAEGMAEVTVSFTPTAVKSYTDSITITSNDADSVNYIIPLLGEGVLPSKITIPATDLTNSLTFGTTKNDTIIIKNTGDNDLTYDIRFTLNKAPVKFTKKPYANWKLPENQDRITDNVWITRGDFQGIFNIADEPVFERNISPVGTKWTWGLTQEHSNINDWGNWTSKVGGSDDFYEEWSSLYIPETKSFYDIFVTQWSAQAIGGGFSWIRYEVPGWLKTNQSSATIAPGDSVIVVVSFDARYTNEGTYNANVEISSNDPANPKIILPAQIKITGVPGISASVANVDFDAVVMNKTNTQKIILYSSGSDTLDISKFENKLSQFTIDKTAPVSLLPGKRFELTVSFKPTALATYNDTLDITNTDPGKTKFRIPLTGIGAEPATIVTTKASTLVKAIAGTIVKDTIYIKNTGKSDLYWTIKDIVISGVTPVTFTKEDYADPTLSQNQDRISDYLWITRDNEQGIYNIKAEGGYNWGSSPQGSSWSYLPVINNTNWTDWRNAGWDATDPAWLRTLPGKTMYMRDNNTLKYYDVLFNSWTAKGFGGGFSYTRTEKPNVIPNNISDVVAEGDSSMVIYIYDATKMVAGNYNYSIMINSNDSTKTMVTIPVTFKVTGIATIDVPVAEVNMGTVYKNVPDTMEVTVNNTGTDTLKISSITLKGGTSYKVSPASMNIPAKESAVIKVSITAPLIQEYIDTLIITSNSTTNNILKRAVKASVSALPAISVSGLSTDLNLFNDVVWKDTLVISNTGDTTLTWDAIEGPSWMTPSKFSGSVLKTKTDTIFVTVDANLIDQGVYNDSIVIGSNDPNKPAVVIYIKLQVNGIKLVTPIADVNVKQGFATKTVDMTGVFIGVNNPLEYTVGTSDTNIIKVSLAGNIITLTEKGTGMAVITVMALDTKGYYLFEDFNTNVNADPTVKTPIVDISGKTNSTQTINLDTYFVDADGDAITYTASSSNPAVASVTLTGNSLTINMLTVGSATISVTAVDANMTNPAVKDEFTVTVAPNSLEAENSSIAVYPNPASDKAYIKLENSNNAQRIRILNISGAIIEVIQVNAGTEVVEIDLSAYATGVYVIEIINNNSTSFSKLVVE